MNKSTTLRIIMSSLDKKQGSVPKQITLLDGFWTRVSEVPIPLVSIESISFTVLTYCPLNSPPTNYIKQPDLSRKKTWFAVARQLKIEDFMKICTFLYFTSKQNKPGLLSMRLLFSGFYRSHIPPHISKMEHVADVILIILVVSCIGNVSLHALSIFKFREIASLES